jgi:hypothetical protein
VYILFSREYIWILQSTSWFSVNSEVEQYRQTPAAQATFRRRKWSVEPAFGELKTARGVRQANLRGNWKVQVQMLVAFAAYNIKRLVKHLSQRARPEVAADQSETRYPATSVLTWFPLVFDT